MFKCVILNYEIKRRDRRSIFEPKGERIVVKKRTEAYGRRERQEILVNRVRSNFFFYFFFCKFFHLHRGQRREIDTRSCQINRREEEGEEEQEEILARLALQL